MSRRRATSQLDAPGQDSFLDIVANLVGILIILVVVVGAHAKVAWKESTASSHAADELETLRSQVTEARRQADGLYQDNHQLEQKIDHDQSVLNLRRAERDALQIRINLAQQQIQETQTELNTQQRNQFDRQLQLQQAEKKLADLIHQTRQVSTTKPSPKVIEHIPTPIAQTVFGREVHFRLKAGRLVYVPLDELVDRMRAEWKAKADKLKSAPETLETVGPVGDFRLQYKLRLATQVRSTQYGQVQRQVPEFVGFVLRPVREPIGVPFQEAIQTGSTFERHISGLVPEQTTISVWVYPDSYNEFFQLKRWLYQRGFPTASWPLPFDQPISGGPNGLRSTAQ